MTLQRLAPPAVSLEHARSHMTESAAELNQRRLVVEEKATARAELLGGEATASHRTRINEARRTARETLAKAREAKSAAAGAFQSASARCEEATPGLEAAKNRRASAEGAFDMACQDIARSPGQVFTLIAADPAVCRALRRRIQEIDRTVNDADAAVLMRREDLERSLEGFDETTDAEVSTAAVATLTTEIGDLHQRTGTLYVSLARDDDARRIAASLSAEIETAQAELAIWQAVDDAIGSANGDRFRRFVQGITLDHMVQLANDHLNALSPRYRLAPGKVSDLALYIIDRDNGR